MPNDDEVMGRVLEAGMSPDGSLPFGRRPYEDVYGFWARQKNNPFTGVLDNVQSYVASSTLTEPLPWGNSTLLNEDLAEPVARLKEQIERDISVLGSGVLVRCSCGTTCSMSTC